MKDGLYSGILKGEFEIKSMLFIFWRYIDFCAGYAHI